MKYEINKETILKYNMKDEFPEMFELQVGKWYKRIDFGSTLVFCEELTEYGFKGYGFDQDADWICDYTAESCNSRTEEATEQEVFEALKNEATNRGYRNGNYRCLDSPSLIVNNCKDIYHMYNEYIWFGTMEQCNCIFKDGKWAEIIPTITKKEAEEKFGVKII